MKRLSDRSRVYDEQVVSQGQSGQVQIKCPHCQGSGKDEEAHRPTFQCEPCKGTGKVWRDADKIDRRCCVKDTDNDGNCPIHSAPGVLREVGLVTSLPGKDQKLKDKI